MNKLAIVTAAAALAAPVTAGSVAGAAPATATTAAARHFEGTVVSVDRGARTFKLRDSERGTVRIRVTSSTRFQRVGGFAGLRSGLSGIEATVRRSGGAWVATAVERSGGGGQHGGGGHHGGGHDDGANHG
jgi:hypothetical protein